MFGKRDRDKNTTRSLREASHDRRHKILLGQIYQTNIYGKGKEVVCYASSI